ncbi:MAG: class A beta-lactamase [Bryobacterales bacterium]|nr:class A beta-lactamase [Bryobacterales bacterium]
MLKLFALFLVPACFAGSLQLAPLEREFQALTAGFDGRVGVCAQDAKGHACINAGRPFSLQSVMKLLAAIAAMDAVDHHQFRLEESVLVRRQDLSLFHQPLADLVTDQGYRTTNADLIRRAVIDSDSAAADILVSKLGGPRAVQACLTRLGISGIRIDRDERHLQTEIAGLEWKPEFVDAVVLKRAIDAVPTARRDKAYRAYQTGVRDTSTPDGMTAMLLRLATGKLLSGASTKHLVHVMEQTATGEDRLKAGLAPGWKIGHKTGTSGSWKGVTAATNDVGILTAPDGGAVSIAVFVADTKASPAGRAALMSKLAAAAIRHYGTQ